ncbi:MAG: hypothetical protein ACI8XX_000992 [Polaribacter sp.]|jgi:hypothetical protein
MLSQNFRSNEANICSIQRIRSGNLAKIAFPHDCMDVAVRRSSGRAMQEQLPNRFTLSPTGSKVCFGVKLILKSSVEKYLML